MVARIIRLFRHYIACYDSWLRKNGLDKPCRSCIPQEHPKQDKGE